MYSVVFVSYMKFTLGSGCAPQTMQEFYPDHCPVFKDLK